MISLFCLFAYASFLMITLPIFFPHCYFVFFAPFLINSFYRFSFPIALLLSFLCGLIVDLFSAHTRLGIYAFNYCLTTFFLYRYKFYFFEDRLSTLPIMTVGFTFLSTSIQLIVFMILGQSFSYNWDWIKMNFFWVPIQNAFYAGIAFTIPYKIANIFRKLRVYSKSS